MLFNSPEFMLLFLPALAALFYLLPAGVNRSVPAGILLTASVLFYVYWDLLDLLLLLISTVFNYQLAKANQKHPDKRRLTVAIVVNLGCLFWFKHRYFAGALLGWDLSAPIDLVLPLAISFYTFHQVSVQVDAYRQKIMLGSYRDYLLYILYFPHLIAGPIVRYHEIAPQLQALRSKPINHAQINAGLILITLGLIKKVVVADRLAVYVDPAFASGAEVVFIEAWTAMLAYTLQLYFDFSGYCDMAIGASKLFGVDLPINFNSPYKALSIKDFWRRWHMTLGRFLKDYLYIPLGGNRVSIPRHMLALLITMTLAGLWHGAGWTFIVWGALHGAALIVCTYWQKAGRALPVTLSWLVTFAFVALTWVIFRAPDLDTAFHLYSVMAGAGGIVMTQGYQSLLYPLDFIVYQKSGYISGIEILVLLMALPALNRLPNSNQIAAHLASRPLTALGLGPAFAYTVCATVAPSVFLYFTF